MFALLSNLHIEFKIDANTQVVINERFNVDKTKQCVNFRHTLPLTKRQTARATSVCPSVALLKAAYAKNVRIVLLCVRLSLC